MINGSVDESGVPFITVSVGGREWKATIDTGFNGDLELPLELEYAVNPRYFGIGKSLLAGNQVIQEDQFIVDFPFDGETVRALATFVDSDGILIGTNLIREYQLVIDFPLREVSLDRTA